MENFTRVTVLGTNGDFDVVLNDNCISSIAIIEDLFVITMTNGNVFQTRDNLLGEE